MALQPKAASDAESNSSLTPPPRAAGAAFERSEALVVSATFLRAAFGGAAVVYALWLGRPCSSVVVVHLLLPDDDACSVQLSSDRLCFTPENFAAPQLVRVDVVENRPLWNVISHRLFSLDRNYDRAHTPTVVVQTEVTLAECPMITFGGLLTKRKAVATGPPTLTRLDLLGAMPDDPSKRPPTDCATVSQAQDGACCISHMASGCNFSVVAVVRPKGNALVAWGLNTNGELGNGTLTSAAAPQPVTLLPMLLQGESLTVSHLSCGKHHVAVVTGQARLFTWGSNRYGQLGLGDFSSRSQPEEVRFALATLSSHRRALRVKHTVQRGGNNVTHVACGAAHTLFVTHQQQILGMGYNQAGQLGLGHQLQQHKGWRSCTPIVVESLRDQSILDLAAGQNHSACVLSNGDVYTWGCGDDGRLGNGKSGKGATTPTLLKLLREIPIRARAVRCGARHMAVLSDRDLLYIWGANEFGQLGCRDTKPRSHPHLLAPPTLFEEGVADVAFGEFHSTCVTLQGNAFAWGLNLRNDVTNIGACDSPHIVVLPERERVKKVSCGWTHTNVATYVVPDETGASRQETNFDRKREKERLLQRKDEVMRWRAIMSAAMASTHRCNKPCSKSEQEAGAQARPVGTEGGHSQFKHINQSSAEEPCEQPKLRSGIAHPLQRVIIPYVDQAVEKAKRDVFLWLHGTRVNSIRRNAGEKHNSSVGVSSFQLRGIFHQSQPRPPELPAGTLFSTPLASPRRKLLTAVPTVDFSPLARPPLVSTLDTPRLGSNLQNSLAASSSRTSLLGVLLQDPGKRAFPIQMAAGDPSLASRDDSSACTSKYRAHSPSQKRTARPSPRSQVAVVEALMHQPSYSITQGALTSVRARQPK